MTILDAFLQSFAVYYGLDWVALMAGVYGSYLMTNRNRLGFLMTGIGCVSGFAVAMISGQFGFVVYNAILMVLMVRGFLLWGPSYHGAPEAAE